MGSKNYTISTGSEAGVLPWGPREPTTVISCRPNQCPRSAWISARVFRDRTQIKALKISGNATAKFI